MCTVASQGASSTAAEVTGTQHRKKATPQLLSIRIGTTIRVSDTMLIANLLTVPSNPAAAVDAPITCLFVFEHHRRRATEQRRWT